jgi:hypothetical protein
MKRILLSAFLSIAIISVTAQTAPTPPPPEDYIGKYVFPEGSPVPEIEVTVSNGVLNMNSAAGASTCTFLGVDSFYIDQFSGTAVFKRGDDKKVNGVHIEAGGYILDGQKTGNGLWLFIAYKQPYNRELVLRKI